MINKISILNGTKYFSSGMFQTYLVSIPSHKFIKYFNGTTWIHLWESNRMSEENIENITKSDCNFAPTFVDQHVLPATNFNGQCLTNNISIPNKVINIYTSYILNHWPRDVNTDFVWGSSLFGFAKLTKNVDLDNNKYSNYSIGFDSLSKFSFTYGEAWGKCHYFWSWYEIVCAYWR